MRWMVGLVLYCALAAPALAAEKPIKGVAAPDPGLRHGV